MFENGPSKRVFLSCIMSHLVAIIIIPKEFDRKKKIQPHFPLFYSAELPLDFQLKDYYLRRNMHWQRYASLDSLLSRAGLGVSWERVD